jgi:hypothetical protein
MSLRYHPNWLVLAEAMLWKDYIIILPRDLIPLLTYDSRGTRGMMFANFL